MGAEALSLFRREQPLSKTPSQANGTSCLN